MGKENDCSRPCESDSLLGGDRRFLWRVHGLRAHSKRQPRGCPHHRASGRKKEISIQQIRELEKELNFRSFSGKKKIAIVDPATLMNLSAQNALLKTLEEPPRDSLLILIAVNGGALLPTLRSRCLRISFGPLARDLISDFLVSRKGLAVERGGVLGIDEPRKLRCGR